MEKTPQKSAAPFSPQIFGDYILLDRVAVGGMAEIFKAKQSGPRGFERILVIKRILSHLNEDQEFKQMFDDEAKIAAQLRHANIVQIFELGDVEGIPYIAMEYVEGRNLRDLTRSIQSKGLQLSLEQVLFIVSETLRGLQFAHHRTDSSGQALEIIHRDMSPQNIILSYEGEVKILDFGIAKAASRISKTEAGVLKGKFSYMSPEQASGRPISQSTDVYACGVILHELLTGERLFRAESDIETLERVKAGVVPVPSSKNPQVPTELDAITLKCLQRNPEKRFASAGEMQSEIAKLIRERGFVYGPQELSAFMKTLFSDLIIEERERLKEALASAEKIRVTLASRTHIAFKSESTPSQKSTTRIVPSTQAAPKKSRGFLFLLALLFLTSLSIFFYAQIISPQRSEPASPQSSQGPKTTAPEVTPNTVKPSTPPPTKDSVELPKAEDTQAPEPKVDEILVVDKPPPPIQPETRPLPRSAERPRVPRIQNRASGTLDVKPGTEGYAELFINNQAYGYVPGLKATNIQLPAGRHEVRCESGSRIYTGTVVIEANKKKIISCSQLR